MLWLLSGLILLSLPRPAYTEEYTIGLLTSSQNTQKSVLEAVIPYAVDQFNANSTDITLKLEIASYNGSSLYELVMEACKLVNKRTVAVISPDGSNTVAQAADVFSPLNVPIISLVATDPHIRRAHRDNMLLLSPSDAFQSKAILDLLGHFRWHEISIIASDSNYGINGVHYLQQLITRRDEAKFVIKAITFFNAVPVPLLNNTLKNIKRSLARVIILNCESQYASRVLEEAFKMGLMAREYVWIVTDAITGNPHNLLPQGDRYSDRYSGLIGIRLAISKNTRGFRTLSEEFEKMRWNISAISPPPLTPSLVLSYDAVQIAGKGLATLAEKNSLEQPDSSCSHVEKWAPWSAGDNYFDVLKSTSYHGASGLWTFTEEGTKDHPGYEIVNLRRYGYDPLMFYEIGTWSENGGLQIEQDSQIKFLGGATKRPMGVANSLNGEHLVLGVTDNPPFASKIPNCTDTICWEGICPDVVMNLSSALNFTYEFVEPADKAFGRFDPETQTWNGLIGDMLSQKTDMITMDLSVGVERKRYIDFTVSFMDSGISLAMKGESGKSDIFFFMSPFGYSVWCMIVVVFIFMGIILNLISKLSPYGSYGKKIHAAQVCKCEECEERRLAKQQLNIKFKYQSQSECLVVRAREEAEDETMTFYNSLWVAGAGLVGQGTAALPASPSGRFILFIWWFFILLIISMYTANLTAFMTLDKIGITINSAKELLKQHKKKYEWGIIEGSFVESLLINNVDPDFKKLVDGAVKVKTVEEGNQRVHQGGFAFLDETPFLSYNLLGSCDIFQIGGEIQPFDYGFGLPKSSPYTELMNTQIIKYRELGFFDELWAKWDKTPADGCDSHHDVGADEVLQMSTLQGIFLLLALGLIISVALMLLETVVATAQDDYDEIHRTFWAKLVRRVRLKYEDIRTEWFMSSLPHRPSKNGDNYQELLRLDSMDKYSSSEVKISTNHAV